MNKKTIILRMTLILVALIAWVIFLGYGYLILVGLEWSDTGFRMTPTFVMILLALGSALFLAIVSSIKVKYYAELTKSTIVAAIAFVILVGYQVYLLFAHQG